MELALLIDDNAIDNEFNKQLILNSGLAKNVLIKNSSKEAINFLTINPNIPDIILLDVTMPIRDGVVFMHEFHNLPDLVKVLSKVCLINSNLSKISPETLFQDDNIVGVLQKPLTIDDCQYIRQEIDRDDLYASISIT